MVRMESVVSGHKINKIRERLGDKLEIIQFDPLSKYIFNSIFRKVCLRIDNYSLSNK